ncbi:multidrug effflux MFS transporter [Carboxydothermus pertinax]|uniref:Bcr/CflA family efflux transporter n=1 Tax=Carboxydothermus pertinax TaxID=870242 RepID=A0A1L8CVI8_9THEO|nr:multidrug effflux MFS transporter [Carboxydothermus pertinax]GAV22911.1 MFS transporter [Carboxydothermus pertinax]
MEAEQLTSLRFRNIGLIFILGTLTAFAPLSIDMYLPSLPSLARDLHTHASLVQLSLTACLVGLAIGQLIFGSQSDIYGRRPLLIWGLFFYTLSSFLCAVSTSVYFLIALRFVEGFTGAAGIVIARAVVRDLYNGVEMMRFTANLMLINGLGPIAAPVIGAELLRFTSWRGVFVVLGLVGLLMLLAVYWYLPETLPPDRRLKAGLGTTLKTYQKLLKDRSFLGYALPQGLVSAAMFAYIAGSPFVIQNIYGASPQFFSLIFATNGLGIILAGQLAGRLAGKISGERLYKLGLYGAFGGGMGLLIAILIKTKLFFVLLPLFFVVSMVGVVGTAGSALALENYGELAGSASAFLGLLAFVLGAAAAPLVGLGGKRMDFSMAIVIMVLETFSLGLYHINRRSKL